MKLIKLIKNLFKKPSVYDELMEIRKANEANLPNPVEIIESTIDLTKYLTNHPKQFKKLNYYKSELITKVPKYVQFEKLGLEQEILDKNKYYYRLSLITRGIKSIKRYEEWLLSGSSPENCLLLEQYNNIFEASNKSNLFGIMYYLYYGTSINAKDENGNTLLSNAIRTPDLAIMIYCLAYKAELPTIIPNCEIFELDDNLQHIVVDMTLREFVSANQKLITCDYLLYHQYVELQKIEVKTKKLITKKSTKEDDLITLKHFAYWAKYAYDRSISIYNLYKKEEQDNQSGESDKKNHLNYQTRFAQDNDFRQKCPTYESYLDNLSSSMNSVYDSSLKDLVRSQEKLNDAKKRLEDKYSFSFDKNSTYVELIAQFKQVIQLNKQIQNLTADLYKI